MTRRNSTARADLLDRARAVPTRQSRGAPSQDEVALAIAYMKGEVTTAQVGRVVEQPSGGGARNWVLTTLTRAVRNGMVRLETGR